ncbi:uncharacterized protein LOC114283686 [Camellia sinensis]|uniref:uncharacterized protein LOC114283686 n=1 Tax=Camellia sinensis TaxID=4442 RepID=UPI001036E556|nr:uncharacterized protein LOC114283686 [Camellia sinensis]
MHSNLSIAGLITKALSAPNLSALDFPALSVHDGQNGLPKYAGDDIQQSGSPYRYSSKDSMLLFKSSSSIPTRGATDFASAVRKMSSQDSGIWKYERNGSADASVGSSRSAHLLASSYSSGQGRSIYGDRLQSRSSSRTAPVWLETGEAVANMYSEMREEARDHARLRNAYFEQLQVDGGLNQNLNSKVLLSICSLLTDPHPDDPLFWQFANILFPLSLSLHSRIPTILSTFQTTHRLPHPPKRIPLFIYLIFLVFHFSKKKKKKKKKKYAAILQKQFLEASDDDDEENEPADTPVDNVPANQSVRAKPVVEDLTIEQPTETELQAKTELPTQTVIQKNNITHERVLELRKTTRQAMAEAEAKTAELNQSQQRTAELEAEITRLTGLVTSADTDKQRALTEMKDKYLRELAKLEGVKDAEIKVLKKKAEDAELKGFKAGEAAYIQQCQSENPEVNAERSNAQLDTGVVNTFVMISGY